MTLVERVARGLHAFIAPDVPWDNLDPASRNVACDVARAGIVAMRVPTEAMKSAGKDYLDNEYPEVAADLWAAMIAAALTERDPPQARTPEASLK